MDKQRFKKLWFLVSIVLGLILIFSSIQILNGNTITTNIEDTKVTYTTSSVFEEFVKSDGTTYNFEDQNIEMVTEVDTADILYGSYQFNYTGAASIVKEALKGLEVTDQWYSKLSTIGEEYEWLAKFEKDSLYANDEGLRDVNGNLVVRGNSSAGKLVQQNPGDKIYKAYLVISNKEIKGRRLLKEFPVTLIGPNGKYLETKIENIREFTEDRYAGYMDVTEFVKDQGYGWYYCCNVPYLWAGEFGSDQYAAWKLVVIEENPTIPIRALTLKLGLQKSNTDPGTSIEINSKDIKTKSEGEVTGQILYSIEGADTEENMNYLKFIVDNVEYTDIYKETGSTKVLRTDAVPTIDIFTRNGMPIENLFKFDDKADNIEGYVAYKYTVGGKQYTLAEKRQGSDGELIDINSNNYTNLKIGNNKSSVKFNFKTSDACVLYTTALGLAIDIESTDYDNTINTEMDLTVSEKEIVVTGQSKNIYGNNNTGLHETKTIINLDNDIIVDKDRVKITAYWQKNGETEQINVTAKDILIEENKITISWGDDLTDVEDLTLLGDTLTFEITGLEVKNIKPKYTNDISVTGKLYSSGVKTDKVIGEIAKEESYIEYGDLIITKEWLDNNNILNLRPNAISVDLYRNDTKIGTYKIETDKEANTQTYVISDLIMSDDSGKYNYYIKEHEVNLSNGDSYESEIVGNNITNKLTGTISKTVDVTWVDKKNANDTRPENLNVELYQNGIKLKEYNLTVEEEDSYTFTNLEKYDENGNLYEYTVDVTNVPIGYEKSIDDFEITNTLVKKDYIVEYYYDKIIEPSKTEVISGYYKDIIDEYEDKNITGYTLEEKENFPLTIGVDETQNIIKIYYVKDKFKYKVEYYYDGIINKDKTETLEATYLDEINDFEDKNIPGYKFIETKNLPLEISEIESDNIIKVYYEKDEFDYTIEYYYDGIRDDTKTDIFNATYLDVIKTYTDKNIAGYKLESTDNVPLTIREVSIDNIIRVYYVKDKFNYKVEYYYDGVIDNSKTVVSKVTYADVIETYTDKNKVGYILEKEENLPLTVSENVDNNIIKIYYVKDTFEYTIEYYYDGIKDTSKTEKSRALYKDVINTYTDNIITGYKLEKTENLPLTITEQNANNIIKIYYVKADYNYTINYYYDGVQDTSKTVVLYATYQDVIEEYPDKTEYGYKFSKVKGLPLKITENPEENVIDVYYERKDSTVRVKYVDKLSGKEIEDEMFEFGKVLDSFDISGYELEIDGYTLIEKPKSTIGRFEEEEQTFIYYYAITSNVIIRYLEKDTDIELLIEEEIIGYEGKPYSTTAREIDNYTFVESSKNTEGTMDKKTIEVIYYYLQNTSVRVDYIDRETGDILDKVIKNGKVGDVYETKAKDFENYILVEEPVDKTVVMTKDEIIIEYYYAHISEGVIEKHIDIMTGEILDNRTYPGNEGDEYETSSKKISGYDLVENMLPENTTGIMTINPIEVKYYYIRKTSVRVEYIDIITGENILDENEEDCTEIINGHEGDSYQTTEKVFKDYVIVKDKYPKNASGTMKVETDENGKVNTMVKVIYYYVHKSEGVEEQFIDQTTGEIIKINKIEGNEGDSYTSEPIEIPGYDLVEEKLPTNTKGEMTIEKIEIQYYYIRKIKVIVEYIDIITGKKLQDANSTSEKDTTEIIEGHEGDSYKTVEKKFDDYVIVKDKYPQNTSGTLNAVIQNGTVITDIKVTYYYVHVSAGVQEQFINIVTGLVMDSNRIQGNEGDSYTSTPKEIKGYDLVQEKLPTNSQGLMTIDEIVVKYYYIKKSQVTVQYIDRATRKKIKEDTKIVGNEGDSYKVESLEIKGYELVDESINTSGKMEDTEIIVRFWYEQKEVEKEDNKTPIKDNTNKNNYVTDKTPNTGDMLPVYAITVITLVIIMNITMQIIIVKRKDK